MINGCDKLDKLNETNVNTKRLVSSTYPSRRRTSIQRLQTSKWHWRRRIDVSQTLKRRRVFTGIQNKADLTFAEINFEGFESFFYTDAIAQEEISKVSPGRQQGTSDESYRAATHYEF